MAKRKSSKSTTSGDPTPSENEVETADTSDSIEISEADPQDADVGTIPDPADEPANADVSAEHVEASGSDKHSTDTDPETAGPEPSAEESTDNTEAESNFDSLMDGDADKPVAPSGPGNVSSRSGGFLPLFLGGVFAALLGFIAAKSSLLDSVLPSGTREPTPAVATAPTYDDSAISSALEAVAARVSELEATIASLPESQQSTAEVDLSGLQSQIAALSDKVNELASQPAAQAPVPTEALDAALADLRATALEQQAEIDRLLSDQKATIESAETAANATLARTAMTTVQSAIDAGAPFATALAELQNTGLADIPEDLSTVADEGVPSLAALQESVPDAARAALAAARDAETGTGLGGFLQRQLGARAVEPREGSDPDAVLSRVEAATRAGNLEVALSETSTLPAPAHDAMRTWIEQAQSRQSAVLAANELAERLSSF